MNVWEKKIFSLRINVRPLGLLLAALISMYSLVVEAGCSMPDGLVTDTEYQSDPQIDSRLQTLIAGYNDWTADPTGSNLSALQSIKTLVTNMLSDTQGWKSSLDDKEPEKQMNYATIRLYAGFIDYQFALFYVANPSVGGDVDACLSSAKAYFDEYLKLNIVKTPTIIPSPTSQKDLTFGKSAALSHEVYILGRQNKHSEAKSYFDTNVWPLVRDWVFLTDDGYVKAYTQACAQGIMVNYNDGAYDVAQSFYSLFTGSPAYLTYTDAGADFDLGAVSVASSSLKYFVVRQAVDAHYFEAMTYIKKTPNENTHTLPTVSEIQSGKYFRFTDDVGQYEYEAILKIIAQNCGRWGAGDVAALQTIVDALYNKYSLTTVDSLAYFWGFSWDADGQRVVNGTGAHKFNLAQFTADQAATTPK